jgi:hypothetical protein
MDKTETTTMTKPDTKTAPKSLTTRMVAADGATLTVTAYLTSPTKGTWRSSVTHTVKGAKGIRGASATHGSFSDAEKAVAAHVAAATKLGWARAPSRKVAVDAFDSAHLPSPKVVSKKEGKA